MEARSLHGLGFLLYLYRPLPLKSFKFVLGNEHSRAVCRCTSLNAFYFDRSSDNSK